MNVNSLKINFFNFYTLPTTLLSLHYFLFWEPIAFLYFNLTGLNLTLVGLESLQTCSHVWGRLRSNTVLARKATYAHVYRGVDSLYFELASHTLTFGAKTLKICTHDLLKLSRVILLLLRVDTYMNLWCIRKLSLKNLKILLRCLSSSLCMTWAIDIFWLFEFSNSSYFRGCF